VSVRIVSMWRPPFVLAVIDAWHVHTSWFGSLITLTNYSCLLYVFLYLDFDGDVAAAVAVAAALNVLQDIDGDEMRESSALPSLRRAPPRRSSRRRVSTPAPAPPPPPRPPPSPSSSPLRPRRAPPNRRGTSPAAARTHSGAPASRRVDTPPPREGLVLKSRAIAGKYSSNRNPKDGYGFRSGGWSEWRSFFTPYFFGQAKAAGFPSVGRSHCDRGWPERRGWIKYDRGKCASTEGGDGIRTAPLVRVASQPAPSAQSGLFVERSLFQHAGSYRGAHHTTGRISKARAPAAPVATGGIKFTDGGGRGARLLPADEKRASPHERPVRV